MKQVDPFYSSSAWRALRAKVQARWRKAGRPPCGICGKPIDGVPLVDHIQPRKKRPDLALVESNLQCVHHACNSQKAAWSDNAQGPVIGSDGFPVGSGWS